MPRNWHFPGSIGVTRIEHHRDWNRIHHFLIRQLGSVGGRRHQCERCRDQLGMPAAITVPYTGSLLFDFQVKFSATSGNSMQFLGGYLSIDG